MEKLDCGLWVVGDGFCTATASEMVKRTGFRYVLWKQCAQTKNKAFDASHTTTNNGFLTG